MTMTEQVPMKKTIVAEALENLAYSAGSDSPSLPQSQSPQAQEYAHLDTFVTPAQTSELSEIDSEHTGESIAEEMTQADIDALAGFGVSTAADFVESMIDAPVTIDNDTREVIAQKAAPVIAKYMSKGNLPAWAVRFKEEISLGLTLATVAFSLYKQTREYEKQNPLTSKVKSGEVKVSGVVDGG